MGIYYIKNYNGKYLNISGEDLKDLSSHLNVTLWSKDNNSNEQKWVFDSPSSFVKIKSLVNLAYALSHCEESGTDYGTPGNCDVDSYCPLCYYRKHFSKNLALIYLCTIFFCKSYK